jgi:di/tricarboxylate transporter
MSQAALIALSLLIPLLLMALVTTVVSGLVRRAPSTATWKATRAGVLFVVCPRRWQRVLIRTVGIAVIVIGCFLFLVAISSGGHDSSLTMGIAGVVMVIGGILGVGLAHGMTRLRLEVMADAVWVIHMAGAPRRVALSEITELAPLRSNNYGGIVARSATTSLFSATRIMLGYPQLIDYVQKRRPDLLIPDVSRPL